jgi:hypothetical protein
VKIPFNGGSYTGRSTNVNAQKCVNLFPAIDQSDAKEVLSMYGTPGLKVFCAVETEAADTVFRGLHEKYPILYAVIGPRVYSVGTAGVATLLGTITTSTGNVFMADNGTQTLIVDGTITGHYVSSAGVLTDITLPCAAGSVTFQDGYFIITEVSTGKIFISGLYDATSWDALDFATAEANPDDALRVISNAHDLWIFGEKTAEVYYNSGAADFPFDRISGAILEIGLGAVASAVKIDGFLFWMTEKGQVVRNNGYQYQPISTPHIEYQIASYSTISDATAYSYTMEGHTFYVLIFPTAGKTWGFDVTTNYWHEWESYANKDDSIPWSRHRSNCGVRFGRKNIVGDYENGTLYELDMNTFTDNSQQTRRIRAAQAISKDRVNVIYHSLEVEFEAGVGLTAGVQGEDPQCCLDWSDDGGHNWSNEHWVSIGKIGEYTRRAIWRRLGRSRNRILRLTITDPVKVVILAAYAQLEALKA